MENPQGSPGLRWGLIAAIGMSLLLILFDGPALQIGQSYSGSATPSQTALALFQILAFCGALLLIPAALFGAGLLAARAAGDIRSSLLAGLTAIIASNVVVGIVGVFTYAIYPSSALSTISSSSTLDHTLPITSIILGYSVQALVCSVFGMVISGLGGMVGYWFYREPEGPDLISPQDDIDAATILLPAYPITPTQAPRSFNPNEWYSTNPYYATPQQYDYPRYIPPTEPAAYAPPSPPTAFPASGAPGATTQTQPHTSYPTYQPHMENSGGAAPPHEYNQ